MFPQLTQESNFNEMGVALTPGRVLRLLVESWFRGSDRGSLCACKCKNGKGFPTITVSGYVYMYNYNKSNIKHNFNNKPSRLIQNIIMMTDSLN